MAFSHQVATTAARPLFSMRDIFARRSTLPAACRFRRYRMEFSVTPRRLARERLLSPSFLRVVIVTIWSLLSRVMAPPHDGILPMWEIECQTGVATTWHHDHHEAKQRWCDAATRYRLFPPAILSPPLGERESPPAVNHRCATVRVY